MEVHTEAIGAHIGAVETHPGAWRLILELVDSPWRDGAHPGAAEAHCGAVEEHILVKLSILLEFLYSREIHESSSTFW